MTISKFEIEDLAELGWEQYQSQFRNRSNGRLVPNTEVWQDGTLHMRVNSLGCKGGEPRPDLPVIGFFGDSTVMGPNVTVENYPEHINIQGVQPLNCAVEASEMGISADIYLEIRQKLDFLMVVVNPGWHNLIYNDHHEQYWEEKLSMFLDAESVAYCTIATSMTDECRTRGLDALFTTVEDQFGFKKIEEAAAILDGDLFAFWHTMEPSLDAINRILDAIERFNAFIREFALRHGALLIDLNARLRSPGYDSIPRYFWDICHPRPSAFPMIAEFIQGEIAPVVSQLVADPAVRKRIRRRRLFARSFFGKVVTRLRKPKPGKNEHQHEIYPLW